MQLTLNSLSALSVLRELRSRQPHAPRDFPRASLCKPDGGGMRWTRRRIAEHLAGFPAVADFDDAHPLRVAVPAAPDRLRVRGVKSATYASGLPDDAFLCLDEGLCLSSPELLFVELASIMDMPSHLMLGMELCGSFSRDGSNPRMGDIAYRVAPATSIERLADFVGRCRGMHGLRAARSTLEYLVDNAWSPMEAVVATLAVLPAHELGYDLWPLQLNPREEMGPGSGKKTRVPDVLFHGTRVGLNYDGEDHLPIGAVVDAAYRSAAEPGSLASERELAQAIERVRRGALGDKRRDRDLGASGYTVLAITKEDLFEPGGLDRVMLQVVSCIEREGKRKLALQHKLLESPALARYRQELIWSLLPGRLGAEAAARRYARTHARNDLHIVDVHIVDGEVVSERSYPY